VPPSLLISKIDDGSLRPLLIQAGSPTIETVAFRMTEVQNLFWQYDLQMKAAASRAELVRRLNRHDAIITGIISAAVASGVCALAATTLPSRSDDQASALPDFRLPYSPGAFPGLVTISAEYLSFSCHSPFELVAAANGTMGFGPSGFCLYHEGVWVIDYSPTAGSSEWQVGAGDVVSTGQPLVWMIPTANEASATFRVWKRSEPSTFEPCSLLSTDWPIFPPEWRIDR
jgi:hypothetical protein